MKPSSAAFHGLLGLSAAFCGLPRSWAAEPAAGAVVHSDVWHVSRKKGREIEYFQGHVRYEGTDTKLSADEASYDHSDQRWTAKGRVRVQRDLSSGDRIDARGDSGFYNQETGAGRLTSRDKVLIKRTPADGAAPDFASGKKLTWRKLGQEGTLSGGVHAWGPRLKAWGKTADFDHAAGKLVLNGGRPVAEKMSWKPEDWRGAVKADRITGTQPPEPASPKRLDADGRAVGWIYFPSTKALDKPRP